jgi:DNA-binding XRE family transcriptional regulator
MQKSVAKATRERWRKTAGIVIAGSRSDKDLTQEGLAKKVGWSRTTLAKAEKGKGKIELGDVVLIATALDEDPEILIHRILHWRPPNR